MKRVKKYYVGRRDNPQLSKPYFVAYGQLSKADVKRMESSVYGSMTLTGYDTIEDFNQTIQTLESDGFRVSKR